MRHRGAGFSCTRNGSHFTIAIEIRSATANGPWLADGFHPVGAVDLGVIVSLRGGGDIAHADEMSASELIALLRGAVSRAESGRQRSSDTAQAGITVTGLGELALDSVIGVIPNSRIRLPAFAAPRRKAHLGNRSQGRCARCRQQDAAQDP
jgi:hypothetical protein